MAEIKAGDLNLQSLDTTKKWNRNYEILVRSESASEIMNILLNATQKERVFYAEEAEKILFCNTEVTTGIGEHIGAVASTGTAAAAGGVAASILGASTTGGIFGFFATTTTAVVAAPVALVAGAAVGAAALGYGAYKLASKSAEEKGKEKHYKETKQEGRYISNNVRKLNPFVLVSQEFGYKKIIRIFNGITIAR